MRSNSDGFADFLKSMLKGVEEKKDGGTRLGGIIEELKSSMESDFEEAKKGFSSKCGCLSCRCMAAVEDVINKEVQAKGVEYQKEEKKVQSFFGHAASRNREAATAISNTSSAFYDVLADIMKKHCTHALCVKIAEEKGYMKT